MELTLKTSVSVPQPAAPAAGAGAARPTGNVVPAAGKDLPQLQAPPTPKQVAEAVQQIQTYLSNASRQLQFQMDDSTGRTIIRVVNPDSGEVIRQIPSEELLVLARFMAAQGGGLLNDLV